jgi:hypothetical protein
MSGGDWITQRERKQLAADAREELREAIRLEKRQLRDLRYCAERSTLTASDWADFLTLHQAHGKEGLRQLWEDLIPYWETCQRLNGGSPCPPHLTPQWLAEIKCRKSAHGLGERSERNRPTTRKAPGSPRKPRADRGKTRPNYKSRT